MTNYLKSIKHKNNGIKMLALEIQKLLFMVNTQIRNHQYTE